MVLPVIKLVDALMIPKRTEWKSWSVLEKTAYVAQFAAALALLPTVMFAYLGWREARLARNDQAQFFLAEKAPHLEISGINNAAGLLTIEFKNTGESVASNISMQLLIIDNDTGSVKNVPLLENQKDIPYSVQKNQTLVMPVQSNIELEKILGFIPSEISLYDLKTINQPNQSNQVLYVLAYYTDIQQMPRIVAATAYLVKAK